MIEQSTTDDDLNPFALWDEIEPNFKSVACFWRLAFLRAICWHAEELLFRPLAKEPLVVRHQQFEYPMPPPSLAQREWMFKVAARLIAGGTIDLGAIGAPKPRWTGALRARISNWMQRDLSGKLAMDVCGWRLFWSATCSPRRQMVRFVYLSTIPDDPTYRGSLP